MWEGRWCWRPIYNAPAGVDGEPVCLMHSRNPNKDQQAFQEEFERILKESGEGVADFSLFVFPKADFQNREFIPKCIFWRATFPEGAVFFRTSLTRQADFTAATFTKRAVFLETKFRQEANFRGAVFTQEAEFREATFTQEANFRDATFTQWANFGEARFMQEADFVKATFSQQANFSEATFAQEADFFETTFTQGTSFGGARFTQGASFLWARFMQKANFFEAAFTQRANFTGAKLDKEADFRVATFGTDAWFRETKFRNDGQGIGPVFSQALFEKPERVEFYQAYLGQALFHNCDVSKFVFSNVSCDRLTGVGNRHTIQSFCESVAMLECGSPRGRRERISAGRLSGKKFHKPSRAEENLLWQLRLRRWNQAGLGLRYGATRGGCSRWRLV
ncbi:MAG: pentapeptide repeat-containing protein [Acidobacteria bacterium]|nr:pentapeptide repeat-containing protein [Acidobacteriota bacterium]